MTTLSYGQKEAAFWYFGNNAGLNFNDGNVTAILDGKLRTNEGCATISNNNGELLFYSDGITVWSKNHVVMPNGQGLLGNPSSTQSAIIVPKPNSNTIYYIFTVTNGGGVDGLRYSEVDLNLNNGNGDVNSNKNILLATPCSEKISAVQHANGIDFWVVTHSWNSSDFLSFKVTEFGVETTPIQTTIGTIHDGVGNNSIGYMKISPNGTKLALAKWNVNSLVEIFNFDSRTGFISNPILIDNIFDKNASNGAYGVEFSPNSNLLYVSSLNFNNFTSQLHQFDLSIYSQSDIINSNTIIYNGNNLLSAIQLALDGKIYVSKSLTSSLGYIENPNVVGIGCNYVNSGINLNGRSTIYGLPPFIQSYFAAQIETDDICVGEINNFFIKTDEGIESVIWDFGDGTTSSEINSNHTYLNSGSYIIKAELKSGFNTYNLAETIEIFENPVIAFNDKWSICKEAPLTTLYLNSSHDAYLWSTGETSSEIIIDKPGIYNVTVYNFHPDGVNTCEATIDIKVIESGLPEQVKINVNDWTSNRNSITINAQGIGDYEYSLDNMNYQDGDSFYNLLSGEYMVYIRDKNGCGYIVEIVYVLNYPKYFTPNGDGTNDNWKIYFSETEPDITIHIFDRYGKLLKQLSPISMGWDGTYNGVRLSSSDYWFIVNRPSKSKQYTGHFTLKR